MRINKSSNINDPIGYWKLGVNANDNVSVNNGTASGATFNNSGPYSAIKSTSFDGIDDYIEIRDPSDAKLGLRIFQSSMQNSPCPAPQGKPSTGALLLIVTPEMADDPGISNHMESAISYVGGRSKTLFSGVYVRQGVPGLIAITAFGGLK